jgi:DNA gyrase subunit A
VTHDSADRTDRILRDLRAQMHVYSALVRGLDDWLAVMHVVADADDRDDATGRLRERFGFDDEQAQAVLSLQVRRLSRADRDDVRDEVTLLQGQIDALTAVAPTG